MASDAALKKLFTATPPKITVVLDAPIFCAVTATSNTEHNAPQNAAPAMTQPEILPIAQQMVTVSPAPELTPIILGDASLFPNTPCMTAPETANAAPESRQATVLGSLEYQKILPPTPLFAPCIIACIKSDNVNFAVPKHKLASTEPIQRTMIKTK